MSQRFTTIIIADSRGKGLEDFVGSYPTPIDHVYVFEIRSGKSISQLTPVIIDTISQFDINFLYCIVFAGICGLTDRMFVDNTAQLRYQSCYREEKVKSIIDVITFLKGRFGNRINFCTIIPADLAGYFRHHNRHQPVPEYLGAEQSALELDINTINDSILALNSEAITNINLSSRAQVKSKKKRQRSGAKIVYRRVVKFSYTNLTDGVHFSAELKKTAFRLIISTAIRDIFTLSQSDSVSHRQQSRPMGAERLCVSDQLSAFSSDSE